MISPKKTMSKINLGQGFFIIWIMIRKSMSLEKRWSCCRGNLETYIKCRFQSKMNTIGGDVLASLTKPLIWPKKDFSGLVVGQSGSKFFVGANIANDFYDGWLERNYDELNIGH